MNKRFSQEYLDYIDSDEWHKLCKRLSEKCNHRCQICGKKNYKLSGHHLTYERLGHELDEDIQMVCFDCHPYADEKRKEKQDQRNLKSEQDYMFEWIEKTYGKDYRKHYKTDDLVRVFYEMKNRKREKYGDRWRIM